MSKCDYWEQAQDVNVMTTELQTQLRCVTIQEPGGPQEVKTCNQQRLCLVHLGICRLWPFVWRSGQVETPQVLFAIFFVSPPLYQCVIHPSSLLLCLAPDSTHGDLFLRHRQMGSSLESCSKLEGGDCSFQERESFRGTRICSCFKSHGVSGHHCLPSDIISRWK